MTEVDSKEHLRAQRVIVHEYRKLGYNVIQSPKGKKLPEFLAGLSPDIIATKGDDRVVIEIKRADTLKGSNDLTELAARVAEMPNWRFELHTLEAPKAIVGLSPSRRSLDR